LGHGRRLDLMNISGTSSRLKALSTAVAVAT
jgi:hypothetical protein